MQLLTRGLGAPGDLRVTALVSTSRDPEGDELIPFEILKSVLFTETNNIVSLYLFIAPFSSLNIPLCTLYFTWFQIGKKEKEGRSKNLHHSTTIFLRFLVC